MARYLIVGLPGTGKSSVASELTECGYNAVDADSVTDMSIWRNSRTGRTTRQRDHNDPNWNSYNDWVWHEQGLKRLFSKTVTGDLYLVGNAGNISQFYPLFERVFALVGSDQLLQNRLEQRKKGYGSTIDELQRVLEWNKTYATKEIERGAILLDASPAADVIAARIVGLCDADR